MAKSSEATGSGPSPRVTRAQRTIVAYYARCQKCPWQSMSPRDAHVHTLVEGHTVLETRNYVLETP